MKVKCDHRSKFSNLSNWKIYCDDHISLSKNFKADVSCVDPSSELMEELWAMCVFICRKRSYAIGGNTVTRKTRIN